MPKFETEFEITVKVEVSYDWCPGSGNGWDEPREPAHPESITVSLPDGLAAEIEETFADELAEDCENHYHDLQDSLKIERMR